MSFIINRWVRGADFYGRDNLLETLRAGAKKTTWVLGNRRVGKSSLLRQVEWLCRQGHWGDDLALYWDLQGAGDVEGLKDSLLEALEDADQIADLLDLDVDALEDASLMDIIKTFRRRIKGLKERRLLLLIDECEELVDVNQEDAGVLNAFRKLTQTESSLHVIMAGSYRLMDLDESDSRTSLFLPDFLPPRLLGPLKPDQAQRLITDKGLSPEQATAIYDLTLGNPHLMQVFGEALSRLGDLEGAVAEVKAGKVAHYFFQSNFQCMPPAVRNWWKEDGLSARLADVSLNDENFPYFEQACVLKRGDNGPKISPLLLRVLGESVPTDQATPAPESKLEPKDEETKMPWQTQPVEVADTAAPKTSEAPGLGLLSWLKRNPAKLLVLPPSDVPLDTADNPPALAMQASLPEPEKHLHELLGRATPEYVRGESPDARTSVYLMGLHLYHHYFDAAPFAGVTDPWERAGAVSEQDVPIPRDQATTSLDGKTAVVLMRCLRADASQRYQDLETLARDLG